MLICALGDLLVDVVTRPVAQPEAGEDVAASTRLGPGGQAANVAAWVAHLGGRSRLVGKRGSDFSGRFLAEELARRGVDVCGPVVDGRTGTVVSIVDGAGERSMLSDRGVSPELAPGELDPEWFRDVDRLHVTGYGLVRPPMLDAAVAASALVREAGGRISVDLSASTAIEAVGAAEFLSRMLRLAPEVVFGTVEEFDALGGEPDVPVVVVKRGAGGCSVRWPGGRCDVPPPTAAVVDTTGAGDAFAAGFLLGPTPRGAVTRAAGAAGECIAQMGSMP